MRCLHDPVTAEGQSIVNCNKKYCTILRQELKVSWTANIICPMHKFPLITLIYVFSFCRVYRKHKKEISFFRRIHPGKSIPSWGDARSSQSYSTMFSMMQSFARSIGHAQQIYVMTAMLRRVQFRTIFCLLTVMKERIFLFPECHSTSLRRLKWVLPWYWQL